MADTRIGFWTRPSSTRHCGLDRNWLVDFNAGNTQPVSFDPSNNTGAVHMKIDGSVLNGYTYCKIIFLLKSCPLCVINDFFYLKKNIFRSQDI